MSLPFLHNRPSTNGDGPTEDSLNADLQNLYERTAPEYNHFLGSHIMAEQRARNALKWQRVIDAIVILVLAVSLLQVVRTGGNHLFAVPVDKYGAPVGKARVVGYTLSATNAAVQNRLATCVKAMFSVSPDNVVNRQNLTLAYSCTAAGGRGYLDGYYGANNGAMSPYVLGRTETVEVIPDKIEGLSAQSYHVLWTEVARTITGAAISRTENGATFSVALVTGSRSAAEIVSNPFGILITTITPDANLQSSQPQATP